MKTLLYAGGATPFGPAVAVVDGQGVLLQLSIGDFAPLLERAMLQTNAVEDSPACERVFRQLAEYFDGKRTAFDIPLALEGSTFERRVWEELLGIPFGSTKSYGEVARHLGAQAPEGARAVGTAAGANKIPVIVPCHRLIGSDGKLVGYGLGLPMKQRLLDLERSVMGEMLAL